ncbi:hypothetical protein [Streptomyces clavuligerus]|nr:hypothetical protein [Streptomyces clavuligerus]
MPMSPAAALPPHAVLDREHRRMVDTVLRSGLLDPLLVEAEEFTPRLNAAQAGRNRAVVTGEMREAGLPCPPDVAHDLVVLQQLILPTQDEALSLALVRMHVFTTIMDDIVSHDRTALLAAIEGFGGTGPAARTPDGSPYAAFAEYMLSELGRFCDPAFRTVLRSFFLESLLGVLFEAEFTGDASDAIDTSFVRGRTGFCAFWFSAAQFLHPGLDFCRNVSFWAAALPSMVDFLNDGNDVLSFYKEALHGGDFTSNAIYRSAVRQDIPYLDAYRATLDRYRRSERRILALADDVQRPYLAHLMTGYTYWHLHVSRYHWQELDPRFAPISL